MKRKTVIKNYIKANS